MKAYVYGANGPEITDVARPVPKGTQVLVKVHACGLNRADLGMTKGHAHGAAGGVGTVLGIGSLVATWGLAQTAANQVASQFDDPALARAMALLALNIATKRHRNHRKDFPC